MLHQRIHKPAVHLKERAVIHAIIEAASAISERRGAPQREVSRELPCALFADEFRTDERGNSLPHRACEIIESNLCRTRGKDRCQQRAFLRIAEERNFRWPQRGRKLPHNLCSGLCSLDQERRRDGAFADRQH